MFPRGDRHWNEVRVFLEGRLDAADELLAPNEFLELFPRSYAYRACHGVGPERFAVVVLHKGMLEELPRAHLDRHLRERVPIFANEVFVILGRKARRGDRVEEIHVRALRERLAALPAAGRDADGEGRTAVLVTTYDRADALGRSLPQIAALGAPMLVVDDGSPPAAASRVAELCDAAGARHLRLPGNRGVPTAVNAGIGYWLADPHVRWISYFQDDVDVRADALDRLARVQDAHDRPILTGRLDRLHPSYGEDVVHGVRVVRHRSVPGIHLHAHRDYWSGVLPIPTPYLGAPKPTGGLPRQGSDEDFWISCWSPRSIVKRGGFVLCVPGLVRTFATRSEDSTWGNPDYGGPDPPLEPVSPAEAAGS